ncbi:MAG: nitrite reductase [Rhizobiales bacterium]|nr:nitrite reductase [Hyphomicrobiales bacterium]MBA67318.1 nitrite reductase [Hyphomicrobiales bacterium]|tara:strand:+ start:30 stop:374 length:345 start_codon:yes stop_codon:yes gene_type:complete
MTGPTTGKILTANRLIDGVSVWFSANGEWVENIHEGFVARHEEAVKALEDAGAAAQADNSVVDANLIDIEEGEGGLRAIRLRERIRADGPTIAYLPNAQNGKTAKSGASSIRAA